MGYGRFRTGDNKIDHEAIKIAKIDALRDIASSLKEITKHLSTITKEQIVDPNDHWGSGE